MTASSVYQFDLIRLQLIAVLVEDADVVVGQIGRLLLHLRDQVLLDDGSRHRPERVEADLVDLAGEERRLPVDLADDGDVAGDDDAVLYRLDLRAGDVDHDIAASRHLRRLDPLQIGLQLRQAHLGGNVEGVQRAGADYAVGRQPVTLLEALHRRLDVGIERLRVAALLLEVAGGDQPAPQLHDIGIAHADAQRLVGRHAVPAAARDKVLVDVDRLLHRRHGARRQDRRRRGDRAGDGRLGIEAFRPFGLLQAVQRAPARSRRPEARRRAPRRSSESGSISSS